MNVKIIIRQLVKMAVQNVLLPLVYQLKKPRQIEKGLVVFADAHHDRVPPSMRPLVQEIKRRGNMRVVQIYDDYQQISSMRLFYRMMHFMKYYAKAEYVVICDNFLPAASCKKRKETTVIQLWHGCGAFKKFGYDTPGDIPAFYKGNVFRNSDLVTVSAPGCVPHFQSAMRLPQEAFQPIGVCRTDKFFSRAYQRHCRELFEMTHPKEKGKKVVLWAPTFRGYPADPQLDQYEDIVKMAGELPQDVFVIIKVHPLLTKKYPYDNSSMTTDQLLPIADLLITDYSSIIFEYSIYRKPMLFYAPDMEAYGVARGFYLDYEKLPGKIVTEPKRLAKEALQALSENGAGAAGRKMPASGRDTAADAEGVEAVQAFYETYMSGCDGKVTKRLADRMGA
ncbi:MAG: CDP-glycerol glycerophosphotransferase family protein [Eubacterium sp.]|nr:CDP-glycerol glycerophosphotransferase family protein [Eubacterium sp.]